MKRKMVYIGISYAIGLFCASVFSKPVLAAMFCVGVALCTAFLRKKKFTELICCIICFIFGFGYYVIYDYTYFSPLYGYDGKAAKISGKVVELSENGDNVTLTVKGTIDDHEAKVLVYADNVNVQTGDLIDAYGALTSFESSYIFDTEGYYNSRGIILAMYNPEYMYVYDGGFSLVRAVSMYADSVKNSFKRLLPNEEGDLLCAMLFGDKSGLDKSGKTMFYRSGIGHIMATSGLHLAVIVSMLMILPFLRKNPVLKAITMLVAGGIFVVCARFSLSVIRAYIMLALCYCAPLFFRKSDTLNSLCISVLIMTIPSPYIISSPSFVLSVWGVLSASVFAPFLCEGIKSYLVKSLAYSACVSVCIIPAGILYFDEISMISPIANILLIPLSTFALCAAAVAFVFAKAMFIAKPLLALAGFACHLVNLGVNFLASLGFASIPAGNKYLRIYIWLAFFGIVLSFLINSADKQRLGVVTLAFACLLLVSGTERFFVEKSHFTAVYSDGSGTVCIVKNNNGISVIDGGAGKSTDFVLKYLASVGIYEIDTVYLVCDAYSSQSEWEYCAEHLKIGAFYNCIDGYEDENVKILTDGRYAAYASGFAMCVTDDAANPLDDCDFTFLLGDDSNESFICESSVKGFVIKENFGNINIDYLEYSQEE